VELPSGVAYFLGQVHALLLSPGSTFSLTSLACALAIGAAFIAYRRHRQSRRIRLRTILRALFPKRITRSASTYVDLGYLYFNVFVNSLVFGWAVLSYQYLTNGLMAGLATAFGPVAPSGLPPVLVQSIITLVLFLAYEIGYWLNHWLSHKIPFMWQFHRVHHSAEVLTPLTNFRVHPVYALIFANILAITAAIANGLVRYAFGDTAQQYAWSDTNIIIVLFVHVYVHLQHSHLWIPFRGVLGRILVSPAHHQVHHSTNPAHFNRNYGSCLAIWDWMFGTLHVPQKEPEVTSFGVEPDQYPAHTITGELIAPFFRAAALFRRKPRPAGADMPGLPVQEQKQ
jgi:sterol desaturase/sphingolipid hydroxylase (fatty acid hydroxylase superfamily)